MTYLPCVCVVTNSAKNNANKVWEAMGRGPDTFSRRLTTDAPATTSSPVTHWLMADSHSQSDDVSAWQAFAEGSLPSIDGTWGVDGVISEAGALDAVSGANLQVYSASGDVTPIDHCNAILASRGLSWVPDEI